MLFIKNKRLTKQTIPNEIVFNLKRLLVILPIDNKIKKRTKVKKIF